MSHIDVHTIGAMIPMSAELLADFPPLDIYDMFADNWRRMEAEQELDRIYGPNTHHKPDRGDWWACSRPQRVRRNILANLPPGRPGRFQKAGGDGVGVRWLDNDGGGEG